MKFDKLMVVYNTDFVFFRAFFVDTPTREKNRSDGRRAA